MKAGFFHDSPLVYENGIYYSRTLGNDVWKRYLSTFDHLTVSTRVGHFENKGLVVSSGANVSFEPISEYKNTKDIILHTSSILNQIRQSLSTIDCAIVRLPSVIGWLTVFAARRMQKPVLIELVGCPWDSYRFHSLGGKLVAPFGYLATRVTVRNAKYVIYVTQHFLQRRYPSKGIAAGISNVNLPEGRSNLENRITRIVTLFAKKKITADQKILIGSIGKVDIKYKGHKSAIEAVARLRADGYNVEYEIVGGGTQEDLLASIANHNLEGKVRLLGPLPHDSVHKWLDSIDLYLQPSLTEGLPRAAIEAMSHGLPSFLSTAGGQPELVSSEFLFSPGNARKIADQVANFLDTADSSEWRSIAERNVEKSRLYSKSALQKRRESILWEFRSSLIK